MSPKETSDRIRDLAWSNPVVMHYLKAADEGQISYQLAVECMVLALAEQAESYRAESITLSRRGGVN